MSLVPKKQYYITYIGAASHRPWLIILLQISFNSRFPRYFFRINFPWRKSLNLISPSLLSQCTLPPNVLAGFHLQNFLISNHLTTDLRRQRMFSQTTQSMKMCKCRICLTFRHPSIFFLDSRIFFSRSIFLERKITKCPSTLAGKKGKMIKMAKKKKEKKSRSIGFRLPFFRAFSSICAFQE